MRHIGLGLSTTLLGTFVTLSCLLNTAVGQVPDETKTFTADIESLAQYECPEWFRDAKFGIWAHWGPQSVPMHGDWYARAMYEQHSKGKRADTYDFHVKKYGHPSEFGYKDIIKLWKAEKFDPEDLMRRYKAAGAKYFVSMAVHHDNFDLWDSKFNPWNAAAIGPKRDIVAAWQQAAQKHGLKFGVSEHLSASYDWFQVSHGADVDGPKAGVPYDGANPQHWDLYHSSKDPKNKKRKWVTDNAQFAQLWYARITDLLENYQPDLLYSDAALPFGPYGERMLANYYNADLAKNSGRLEAVYLAKPARHKNGWESFDGRTCVEDRERGGLAEIGATPWQTDTSIGDWFYNSNWKTKDTGKIYRSPFWVLTTLVDVVSKNGNMLLNVLQRPDGSIDPEVVDLLDTLAKWMAINGESIFETRPWRVFGEGPQERDAKVNDWKEDFVYTPQDIRYTRDKADTVVYATCMGMPTGDVVLREVANSGRQVKSINLLGSDSTPQWSMDKEALTIVKPDFSTSLVLPVFKITWQ